MEPNILLPPPGLDPFVGAAVAALVDTRVRTLDAIRGLTDADMDAPAPGYPNTIGATLYHIAAIEADWIYSDILDEDYPDWMSEWFPFDVREEDGKLSPAPGMTYAEHLDRLQVTRQHFLEDIRRLDPDGFRDVNSVEENPSSPQWVLHHLSQHEAEHRGHIQAIRTLLSA